MKVHKDLRPLIKRAKKHGCTVEETSKSHVRILLNGRTVATIPGTPSDHRSIKNTKADLRRAGVPV